MSEFLHMGGYAFYVWSSYAIAVFLLLWNILAPWIRHRKIKRELARMQ